MVASVSPVLVQGARVFDGLRVRAETSVLVVDGRIAELGSRVAAPSGAVVVDGTGRTLLPGLIDAHTHVFPGRLEQAVLFGVTTELDMFAEPALATHLKRQAAGRHDVADLRTAGIGATAPGGHPTQWASRGLYSRFPTIERPDEADAFVAARVAEGSDYLKVFVDGGVATGNPMPSLDPPTVRALVAAGHERGLLVVAHATDLASARIAVAAGVDGLAHLFVDAVPDPDLVAAAAGGGLFVTPTLVVLEALCGRVRGPELIADHRFGPRLDTIARTSLATEFPRRAGHDYANVRAGLALLHAAGVPILAGSDASNPGTAHGASLHRELELLVEAGMTPTEALTAATAAPARCFGLVDRGRIQPGLVADLLLVDGDPTVDITATRDIVGVWRRGVRLDRELAPAVAAGRATDRLDSVAATARWTAAERARESRRPDRLFDDPLAEMLAGEAGNALYAEMTGASQFSTPTIPVRTRFFDDALLAALRDGGIRQVVLLAAGMDTRAYRLDLPAGTDWFELDRAELLGLKEELLTSTTAAPRCARRTVPADLSGDWPDALRTAGFDPTRATVWLAEGLTPYLDADSVGRLLDGVTSLSAPGSRLLADVVGQSLLSNQWMRPWLDRMASRGMAWQFGTDEPEQLLTTRGWRPDVTQMSTAGCRFGRWPFPDVPRNTPGVPNSFLVQAAR